MASALIVHSKRASFLTIHELLYTTNPYMHIYIMYSISSVHPWPVCNMWNFLYKIKSYL